ncbi:MAG: RluA family pseudouridine synthase [Deltaproteobacteria bacterium]|nr:RluA family pseudouridine synthase [Deltaproteobacteria bacterium]TLN04658.1 MAG: RluA family pseudouridine synthase [bacterium]
MITYSATIADHGRRMDSFVRSILPAASVSYLRQILKGGSVLLNDAPATPDQLLRFSDTIALKETSRIRSLLVPRTNGPDILYEDDDVAIFNKPAGLSVHRSAEHGIRNLVDTGIAFFGRRGIELKLYPVNRLDRETSGLVLLAKSSAKAGAFGKLFQEGLVEKRYLTVVSGKTAESGVIDLPLDEKESRSEFRTLCTRKGVSILSVTPITGRSHQIRRHLSSIGHPVMGDLRYGGKRNRELGSHALHSYRLAFPHPVCGAPLSIFAPLPQEFAGYLSRILDGEIVPLLDALLAG